MISHETTQGLLLLSTDATALFLKVDLNKDRLVSLEEFLRSTEKKEFNNPKEWEVKRVWDKLG